MKQNFSVVAFFEELRNELPISDAEKRQSWAKSIIENRINLTELSQLLHEDKSVAMRYVWLLTDVGLLNGNTLFHALPFLYEKSKKISHFKFAESFANYWLIAGVPEKQEAEATNLCFDWIRSNEVNVTIKSRAIKVLLSLVRKYPDLKNELSICLREQMNLHTENFRTTVIRALEEINKS